MLLSIILYVSKEQLRLLSVFSGTAKHLHAILGHESITRVHSWPGVPRPRQQYIFHRCRKRVFLCLPLPPARVRRSPRRVLSPPRLAAVCRAGCSSWSFLWRGPCPAPGGGRGRGCRARVVGGLSSVF